MSEVLNVVILVGSLRKGSFNRLVAHSLLKVAPKGMSITLLPSIGEIPLYNEDVQDEDGFPRSVVILGEQIRQADGLIISTPEYNYSVPGVLKNTIDWLSRLPNQPFAGKPVMIQSSSMGSMGGVRCQHHLRQILVPLGALVLPQPEFMAGTIQDKVDAQGTQVVDEETIKHLKEQIMSFDQFIKRVRD